MCKIHDYGILETEHYYTMERWAEMTVAEMIKKTRTEANMTQGEYGEKFGVSRQTVSSWENGVWVIIGPS